MRSLLFVESFDFRPSNQYVLVRVIPSCFHFVENQCFRGMCRLKMEATRSFETLVFTRPTQCHIPNDGILQNSCWSVSDMSCGSQDPLDGLLVTTFPPALNIS
jgi:hypothetical protein